VQTRQRKPSIFGSKIQPRPAGIGPGFASIGSGIRNTAGDDSPTTAHGDFGLGL
jgi:hypothetical protein